VATSILVWAVSCPEGDPSTLSGTALMSFGLVSHHPEVILATTMETRTNLVLSSLAYYTTQSIRHHTDESTLPLQSRVRGGFALCGSFPSLGWTNASFGGAASDRQRPCGVKLDLLRAYVVESASTPLSQTARFLPSLFRHWTTKPSASLGHCQTGRKIRLPYCSHLSGATGLLVRPAARDL